MKMNFNFCPNCGGKKISPVQAKTKEFPSIRKWFCPDCGFDLYNNVAAAVGIIISDSKNNVLFEVRAKEPRKGFLALPGGFVDPDESAEEAVIRECREELNLNLSFEDIRFLTSFPNTYEYKEIVYKTCDIFYSVTLPAEKLISDLVRDLSAEKTEVSDIAIYQVNSIEEVSHIPVAFESGVKALIAWCRKKY